MHVAFETKCLHDVSVQCTPALRILAGHHRPCTQSQYKHSYYARDPEKHREKIQCKDTENTNTTNRIGLRDGSKRIFDVRFRRQSESNVSWPTRRAQTTELEQFRTFHCLHVLYLFEVRTEMYGGSHRIKSSLSKT